MKIDANRIRTLREARGWSQEHLASVAGLSARTVQRLESEGKASHESRMAVAAALEVEASQLLETTALFAPAPVPIPAAIGMTSADRIKIVLWIVTLYLLLLAGVATMGKDSGAANRRINEACKANPAECRR